MSPSSAATPTTPPQLRGQRKVRVGIVTSNKMQKTIVVRVTRLVRHPVYQRVLKQTSSFKVHDETNQAAIGDRVKIMETRPISRDKRWRLVDILQRASSAPPVPEEAAVESATKSPSAPSQGAPA